MILDSGMVTSKMHFRTLHIIEEFFLLFRKECNVDIPNVHLSDDVRKL